MRKLYIGLGLALVFLLALATDWNVRQNEAQREDGGNLIQTRDDDVLKLEIGYPGGKGPPMSAPPPSEGAKQPSPPPPFETSGPGPRTVSDRELPERSEEGFTFYEVQPGDTLSQIAQDRLGTTTRAQEIMDLNGITDPKKLKAGVRLKIPTR